MTDNSVEGLQMLLDRYHLALAASRVGVWEWSRHAGAVHVSSSLLSLLGHEAAEDANVLDDWTSMIHPDDRAIISKVVRKSIETGAAVFETRVRLVGQDGTSSRFLVRGRAYRDAAATPIRVVGTVTDLVDTESEAKYRALFEHAPVGIGLSDARGTFECNHWMNQLFGCTLEEAEALDGDPFYVDPAERTQWRQVAEVDGTIRDWEAKFKRADGTPFFGLLNVDRITVGGRPIFLTCVRDITERKRTEEALRESEERFRRFSEAAQEGIAIHDQGIIVDANEALARMFGYAIDDIIGISAEQLATPETWQTIVKHVAAGNENPYEGVGVRKDDTTFHCHLVGKPFPFEGKTLRAASFRDITDLKRAEKALRESEQRYHDLYEHAPDMYFALTADGMVNSVNQFGARYLGYSKESLCLHPFSNIVDEEDEAHVHEALAAMFEHTDMEGEAEFRVRRQDGTLLWVHGRAQLILGEDGAPCEMRLMCRDISDRKHAEELARYKELFESVSDGVFILDRDGRLVEVNDEMATRTGYTKDELRGRSIEEFVVTDSFPGFDHIFRRIEDGGRSRFEWDVKGRDGQVVPCEVDVRGRQFRGTERFLCVARDVTQTRRLRAQLIRSERLAATGQLAASVAHEINSPLQAITVMLNTLEKGQARDSESADSIGVLKGAFESIRNTVRNLMDLNSPGKETKQPCNINEIVEKTNTLVRGHLRKNDITVNLRLEEKIPSFVASPQQLSQLLLNLINNAVEALTREATADCKTREITIETSLEHRSILLRVCDTGGGVSEADLDHIFDPFFTKKKTMGMGVGLSICHGIVDFHGGTITASNVPGGGACFSITFPTQATRRGREG